MTDNPTSIEKALSVSEKLVGDYCRNPGRSAFLRFETRSGVFTAGSGADIRRPAASLLKLPLAFAVEEAMGAGSLDPTMEVRVGDVLNDAAQPGILNVLDRNLVLEPPDILGFAVALSDNACADWLLRKVGPELVRAAATRAGCESTEIRIDSEHPGGPLVGSTSARDAVGLFTEAVNARRYPITARALHNTLHHSRIPLGAGAADLTIAHKSGTLHGVANDVALLRCDHGNATIAFLADQQNDTLVTGYDMGICTSGVLKAWGWRVRRTEAVPCTQ